MSEKIEPRPMSFEVLMTNLRGGLIKIPDFQRQFVWSKKQIIELMDSVYHHYPIGSFLLWITDEKLNFQRNIGNIKLSEAPRGSRISYVLDGQQRITSLFASLEDAEINIQENGKTKKKKIQIFFDLDNKEFIFNPDEQEKETLGKLRAWWPLPGGTRKYVDTLYNILKNTKENEFSEKAISDWMINEYAAVKSKRTTMGYLDLLKKIGFVKFENDVLKITPLGNQIWESRDNKMLLEVLIKNVDFFDDILKILLEGEPMNPVEIHKALEERKEIGWKGKAQVIWRLYWLLSMKFVEMIKKEYKLTEVGRNFAASLKFDAESQNIEDDVRFVSIKKLIGPESLRMIRNIKSDERAQAFSDVVTALSSYKFSVIDIKEQPLDIACKIFERINNAGTPLDVVDLMVAKTWSPDFNLKEKLNSLKQELISKEYESLPDITILQCIATNVLKSCNRKSILSLSRKQFENHWDKTIESIKKSVDFFHNLGIENINLLPFNSMIVPISYFYYQTNCHDEDEEQANIINKWFWQASVSNRYDSGVEGKIGEDIKKFDKIIKNELVEFNYSLPIMNLERIKNQNYSLRNAFCKTLLCLFASKKPINLKNNSRIILKKSFSKYNSKEFHHVFPRNYLKKTDDEFIGYTDSIANIMFMPSLLNKDVLDTAPSVYMNDFNNSNLKNALKTHLVNDFEKSGIPEDNFKVFLDYRANRVLAELKKLVGSSLESIPEDKMIRPDTSFSNKKYLWDAIRKCNQFIYWFDPYFTKNGFEALIEEAKSEKIKKIKVLSGLKQTDERLRELYKKFKEEMNARGIETEFRIITDNSISDLHDRWIISEDICFNLPSINTIDRGQFSEIKTTGNKPPFEDWWSKGKDIISRWNEIEKKITSA